MRMADDSERNQGALKPGDYILLSISDTGVGMDDRVLSRVFEPFFTTKEHGTGLGLSTSYGIVRQNGGDIWATSKPGGGTTFHVCLPGAEPGADHLESPAGREPLSGTETILLVEDDDGVRQVVEAMLKRHGYQVLSSSGSSEALAVAERHVSPIDLLITDVVMPGESGRKVAEGILARRPKTKVLFVSGYGESAEVRTDAAFLQKPFTSEELGLKIREVLREE
jgi:CheY-like chemotaxis protein